VSLYDVIGVSRLKFLAMSEHMNRLDEAVDGWLEEQTEVAVAVGQANSQRTKYVLRLDEVVAYPAEEWGIILGDAVHCLRSGLDQLIWGFIPEPKDRSNRTQYPICLSEREWVTEAPAMYWGVSEAFAELLDKTQPYQRGDVNAARTHPLAVLRALSNLDKHRTIPAIALVADETEAEVIATQGIKEWSALRFKEGKRYEKGAVVAESKIVPDDSGLEPHMDVEVNAAFDIAFGPGIYDAPEITGQPVYGVFTEIAEYCAKILNALVDAWNMAVEETHTDEERERARREARRTYP
jgi:hypothetical protein